MTKRTASDLDSGLDARTPKKLTTLFMDDAEEEWWQRLSPDHPIVNAMKKFYCKSLELAGYNPDRIIFLSPSASEAESIVEERKILKKVLLSCFFFLLLPESSELTRISFSKKKIPLRRKPRTSR